MLYFNLNHPAAVQAQTASEAPIVIINSTPQKTTSQGPAAAPVSSLQCTPDYGYTKAGPVAFDGHKGLVEVTDKAYSHKMYGYTAQQLQSLSAKCPLVIPENSESYINAYTSYWIGWQFTFAAQEDGLCRVYDTAVILHTSQALPVWQNAGQAGPGLTAAWQKYSNAVRTHENGHLQLDQQYASKILAQMQAFQPEDCSTIDQSVNSMAKSLVASLDKANDNYDSSTQHGALQGALVP